jgi:hypothetical protein
MDFKALEDAIRTIWVLPASGLTSASVFFANQDVPSPAPGPCISISLEMPQKIGRDQVKQTFDGAAPAGQEIIFTTVGIRELTVTLQAFSPGATETVAAATARPLLSQVQASLEQPTIRQALNKAGIGVLRTGEARWAPGINRAAWEGRAVLETVFCVTETTQARTGYISTVSGTGTVGTEAPVPYTLEVED